MATTSTAITKIKKGWERAEFWLEVASVAGGLMVGVGLWIEGETSIGQRLVTGGVAMEVICAWWVLVASRKLQNILETEFEALRLETAQANQRASEAVTRGEEANARAAEANLELARIKLPRMLIDEQQRRLTEEMRAYSGEWFSLSSIEDPEAIDLVRVIGACLQNACWEMLEPESAIRIGNIGRGIGRGVRVRVAFGNSPRTEMIAKGLTDALNEKGIVSTFDIQNDLHRLQVIDVLAGTKVMK